MVATKDDANIDCPDKIKNVQEVHNFFKFWTFEANNIEKVKLSVYLKNWHFQSDLTFFKI